MAFISSKLITLFIWACISTLCSANNGGWFWGRPNCTVPSIPWHKRSPTPPLRRLPPSRYLRTPPSRRFPPPPSQRPRTPPSHRCPPLSPPPPRRHLTPPSLQFPPPPPPSRRPRTPPPPSRRPRTPPPSPPPPSRRPRIPPSPKVSPPPPRRQPRTPPFQPIPPSPIVSPPPPPPSTPPFQPIPPSPPSLPSPSLPPSPQPTPQSPRKIIVGGSNQWQLGFDYADWALKNGPFYVNDILVFKYDPPNRSTPPHNVYLLPNMRSFANCNFGKAKMLANITQGSGDGFEFVLKDQNPYYFACGEGNGFHCKLGSMKFTLTPMLKG